MEKQPLMRITERCNLSATLCLKYTISSSKSLKMMQFKPTQWMKRGNDFFKVSHISLKYMYYPHQKSHTYIWFDTVCIDMWKMHTQFWPYDFENHLVQGLQVCNIVESHIPSLLVASNQLVKRRRILTTEFLKISRLDSCVALLMCWIEIPI
jgi:hypothetical protein